MLYKYPPTYNDHPTCCAEWQGVGNAPHLYLKALEFQATREKSMIFNAGHADRDEHLFRNVLYLCSFIFKFSVSRTKLQEKLPVEVPFSADLPW